MTSGNESQKKMRQRLAERWQREWVETQPVRLFQILDTCCLVFEYG